MDIPIRHEFKATVRKMYRETQRDPNRAHRVFENKSDATVSMISIAPVPFILVCTQQYQIGPVWGLGEVYIYIFNGRTNKVVLKDMNYVS